MQVIIDLSTCTEISGGLFKVSCPGIGTTGTGTTHNEAISDLVRRSRTFLERSIFSDHHMT